MTTLPTDTHPNVERFQIELLRKTPVRIKLLVLCVAISLIACNLPMMTITLPSPTPTLTKTSTVNPFPLQTNTPTETLTATMTASPTSTATETATPSETPTATTTVTQTVSNPEGTVLEQANCRYGPGSAYLFEWGLYPGDQVKILNRNWDGSWLDVKPESYKSECWVSKTLLETRGNLDDLVFYVPSLPFVTIKLYEPARNVIAIRDGDQVTVQWEPIWMTEDDDRGYLIEAWVCLKTQLVFQATDYHPWTTTSAIIRDEAGCAEPSSARFYTVEKHGYMVPWKDVLWPQH